MPTARKTASQPASNETTQSNDAKRYRLNGEVLSVRQLGKGDSKALVARFVATNKKGVQRSLALYVAGKAIETVGAALKVGEKVGVYGFYQKLADRKVNDVTYTNRTSFRALGLARAA